MATMRRLEILSICIAVACSASAAPAWAQTCAVPEGARRLSVDDISALSRAAPGSAPTRTEFETTEAFERRRQSTTNEVGGFSAGSVVAIEIPLGDRMVYDADRQRLSLTNVGIDYSGLMPIQIGGETYNGGALDARLVATSNYASTNGFGASVTVVRRDVDLVTFAWPRGAIRVRDLRMNNLSKTRRLENFAPERARTLRERGVIRVIGELRNPVIARVPTLSTTPTFQNPVERRNWFSVVVMQPSAVCIIDGDGETVLDQWQIESAR